MDMQEENGIVYFQKPVDVNFWDFAFQHLGCDSIIVRSKTGDMKQAEVVAYASTEEYNSMLTEIFKKKYGKKDYAIIRNMSEVQAYGIF